MGEYAEYQLQWEMRRGRKDRVRKREGRNPIVTKCPICGRGIRPIAGRVEESMKQHMTAKHRAAYEAPNEDTP